MLVAVWPHQRAYLQSMANLQLHEGQHDRRESPPAHLLAGAAAAAAVLLAAEPRWCLNLSPRPAVSGLAD